MKIKIRRDTTANWVNANPILADGEVGAERLVGGTIKLKIGNGTSAWNDLAYATGGEKGDQGVKGDTGNTGATGAPGNDGEPFNLIPTLVQVNSDDPHAYSYGGIASDLVMSAGHGTFTAIEIQNGCSFTAFNMKTPYYGLPAASITEVSNILIKNAKFVPITLTLDGANVFVDGPSEHVLEGGGEFILFTFIRCPYSVFTTFKDVLTVTSKG